MNEPKPVRIDPKIYEKVALLAHLEKRSVTAEVNHLLEEILMQPATQRFMDAHRLKPVLTNEQKRLVRRNLYEGQPNSDIRFNNPEDKE